MNYQSPIEGCEKAIRQLKKNVREATELFDNIVTVVRCKDCNNGVIYCKNGDIICDHVDSSGNDTHPADWFCADGERRNNL